MSYLSYHQDTQPIEIVFILLPNLRIEEGAIKVKGV
jgi:hypothetical protein